MCEHLEAVTRGGRHKRARKNHGCPGGCSPAAAIQQLVRNQPRFIDSQDEVEYTSSEQMANLLCPLCCGVLDQPVELACDRLVCASCCCRWIEVSGEVGCPCCYDHHLDHLTVRRPTAVIYDLLGSMKLSCSNCHRTATAQQYKLHQESHCHGHYEVSSLSRVSARDILQRPTTAPTLPVERRVAEHLMRRLLSESGDTSVLQIPTRGQVSNLP